MNLTREDGSAVVELTILTPALILLLMFVVAAGRIVQATNDVHGAAAEAARAASVRQQPSTAHADASTTVSRSLALRAVTCRQLDVRTDTSHLVPGGEVSVDVACSVDLSDLGLLGVPGSRTVSTQATETVDLFRSAP